MGKYTVQLVRRSDGRFGWRAIEANGKIVATDGNQGYERPKEALDMAHKVVRGMEDVVELPPEEDPTASF